MRTSRLDEEFRAVISNDKMISDAKRAARRLARRCTSSYQACLDTVAEQAGRRNWSGFLAGPVEVRTPTDVETAVARVSVAVTVEAVEAAAGDAKKAPPQSGDIVISLKSGEGIVLGMVDGRLLRSARTAVVVCAGAPGTGKTMGVVVPTMLLSDHASQLILDTKPELLQTLLSMGGRTSSRIVSLDPLGDSSPDGVERLAFNPLHPDFREKRDDGWGHAMSLIGALMSPHGDGFGYFEEMAVEMFAAAAIYLGHFPDQIPPNGRSYRIASLPAIIDWLNELQPYDDDRLSMSQKLLFAADKCSGIAALENARLGFLRVRNMAGKEAAGVFGTVYQALLVVNNDAMRAYLDPVEPEDGAKLLTMLADRRRPTTAFMVSQPRYAGLSSLHAVCVDVIGNWRSRQGSRARSLQIIIDEAARLGQSSFIRHVMRNGSPAGITVLLVEGNFNKDRHAKRWQGRVTDKIGADHVLSFSNWVSDHDLSTVGELIGRDVAKDELIAGHDLHRLVERDDTRFVITPCMFPKRGGGRQV